MLADKFQDRQKTLLIFALSALLIFTATAFAAAKVFSEPIGYIFGIVFMLCAIVFHKLAKKQEWAYLVSFVLNSAGAGLSASSLYTGGKSSPDLFVMLIGALPAAACIALIYLLLCVFRKPKKLAVIISFILCGLLLLMFAFLWITDGHTVFSFGFFCTLISVFYLGVFALTAEHEERNILRYISFGSCGIYLVITVIVLIIISEGDALEGIFDFGDIFDRKKKKK